MNTILKGTLAITLGFLLAFSIITANKPVTEYKVTLATKVVPKTVAITVLMFTEDGRIAGYQGAGVFISKEGHVLTCAHLVEHGKIAGVFVKDINDNVSRAEILFVEHSRDLAVLATSLVDEPYAAIADPRTVKVGQQLLIVGNPLGLEFSVTDGIISALNRDFPWRYNTTQSNAMVAPGNSGGPAFNMKGEIVGIVSFHLMVVDNLPLNPGLSFFTSAAQIREFLVRFRGLSK